MSFSVCLKKAYNSQNGSFLPSRRLGSAPQAGMTAPGTRRLIFDKKLDLETCDSSTVSLQMGTNKRASQRGMTSYGQPRQVCDTKYCTNPTEEDPYNGQGGEFDAYNQYSE